MQPYHWFVAGLLAAWTPSLLVLAVMLRRSLGAADGRWDEY